MFALGRAVDRFNFWEGYRFSTYAFTVIGNALMRIGGLESRHNQLFPCNTDPEMELPSATSHVQDDSQYLIERMGMAITHNLAQLTDIECTVLAHRFPQEDGTDKQTFQEIGTTVNLSKERIRQIQEKALSKLRVYLIDSSSQTGISDEQANATPSIPDKFPRTPRPISAVHQPLIQEVESPSRQYTPKPKIHPPIRKSRQISSDSPLISEDPSIQLSETSQGTDQEQKVLRSILGKRKSPTQSPSTRRIYNHKN